MLIQRNLVSPGASRLRPVLCSNPDSTVARLVNGVHVIVREVRVGRVKSVELRLRALRETRACSYPIATIRGLIEPYDPFAGEASKGIAIIPEGPARIRCEHQAVLGA